MCFPWMECLFAIVGKSAPVASLGRELVNGILCFDVYHVPLLRYNMQKLALAVRLISSQHFLKKFYYFVDIYHQATINRRISNCTSICIIHIICRLMMNFGTKALLQVVDPPLICFYSPAFMLIEVELVVNQVNTLR
jgi:hypothetical protein